LHAVSLPPGAQLEGSPAAVRAFQPCSRRVDLLPVFMVLSQGL